ncbi:PREDICTED: uncharacterized protein LOC107194384 [Dufourea novaeangliae]|uniref:uncharacterized protein LOC107194384 n=1 Tax=Dufourea novaeangliae TaxID=178035 RepID=UPI0007674B8A|nr:PREDICTED: uncharacterized protein LOC107194384 [Dufourea novaeangliae]
MFDQVSPEKVINFTRVCVALSFCWPLPTTATRSELRRFKFVRSILALNAIALMSALLYSLYGYYDDPANFAQAACLMTAITHALMQICFGITQYEHLQWLIEEITAYCEEAKTNERQILQRYVDRYSMFYGISAIWFYLTAVMVVVGTLFISQPFPTKAEYPFPVDYEPVRSIIFFSQALAGFQCAAHISFNIFVAMLLFFAVARYEILMMELQNVTRFVDLTNCLRKYSHAKVYAQEVANCAWYVVATTVSVSTVALVVGGVNFFGHQPLTVKLQYVCILGTGLLEVFMCALPADHLLDMSQKALHSVYEGRWYEQDVKLQKTVLYTLTYRNPVAVRIKCIVPVLSLKFFGSFVSNAFSFCTALRVIMSDEDGEFPGATMFDQLSPEKVMKFTRICVALSFCWPLPTTATRSEHRRFKFVRSILALNATVHMLALLYSLYLNYGDRANSAQTACLASTVGHVLMQICFGITQYEQLQWLIEEMIAYCEKAKTNERQVLQSYIDRYSMFYFLVAIWFYMTAVMVFVGAYLLNQPFPTKAEYPFPVDHQPVKSIIFLMQTVIAFQCSAHVCVNVFVGMLLFFSVARYEILMLELQKVTRFVDLTNCLRKYSHAKIYAQEVANCAWYVVATTVSMSAAALVLSGLNCFGNQPLSVKVQFVGILGTVLLEVFISALPADHLRDMSLKSLHSVYEGRWFEQDVKLQKTVLYTLTYQNPVEIRINCIVPILSLNYFCSFVSNAFSFFTALRVIMSDEDGEL